MCDSSHLSSNTEDQISNISLQCNCDNVLGQALRNTHLHMVKLGICLTCSPAGLMETNRISMCFGGDGLGKGWRSSSSFVWFVRAIAYQWGESLPSSDPHPPTRLMVILAFGQFCKENVEKGPPKSQNLEICSSFGKRRILI